MQNIEGFYLENIAFYGTSTTLSFFYFSSPIETKENQLFYSVLIVGTIYLFMNNLFYFSAPGSLH